VSQQSISRVQDSIQPISRAYMPPSVTDDWATPRDLFDKLNTVYQFDQDVAANSTNHLCDEWLGLDHPEEHKRDGLTGAWMGHVFCNPPYGRGIADWVARASQHPDLVVLLLPARTDTRWFHDLVLGNATVEFIKGRLKYGNGKAPAPFPSMIVRFN
jgi:phage N-6-adenine-methyltransferase